MTLFAAILPFNTPIDQLYKSSCFFRSTLESTKNSIVSFLLKILVINGIDLLALPPPQNHACIVLAAVDGALSIQEHLVVRAASVFRDGFTPTLIHNLCPINIEPDHISDIVHLSNK